MENVKPLIRTQFNRVLFPNRYEVNNGVSLTVPNQALSIKEIMDRFSRGLPINEPVKIPIYHGDDEFYPDPRKMDLAEREMLIEQNRAELESLQKKVKEMSRSRWIQRKLAFDQSQKKVDNPSADAQGKKGETNE